MNDNVKERLRDSIGLYLEHHGLAPWDTHTTTSTTYDQRRYFEFDFGPGVLTVHGMTETILWSSDDNPYKVVRYISCLFPTLGCAHAYAYDFTQDSSLYKFCQRNDVICALVSDAIN